MERFALAMAWVALGILEAQHHSLRGVIEWHQNRLLPVAYAVHTASLPI